MSSPRKTRSNILSSDNNNNNTLQTTENTVKGNGILGKLRQKYYDNKLLKAVENYDLTKTRKYFEKGANAKIKNSNGDSLLIILMGHLIKSSENDGSSYDKYKTYRTWFIECLLDHGADVNAKNNQNDTALLLSLKHGLGFNHLFLKYGADVNVKGGPKGYTYLHQRVALSGDRQHGNEEEVIKFLLKNGARINEKDDEGNTPLVIAVSEGNVAMAISLIENGANIINEINELDSDGHNRLMMALAKANNQDQIKVLTWWAAQSDNEAMVEQRRAMVEFLLKYAALFNPSTKIAETLLRFAAKNGSRDLVVDLIKRGIDVNTRDEHGNTPFLFATQNNHQEIATILLENGADVSSKHSSGHRTGLITSPRHRMGSYIHCDTLLPPSIFSPAPPLPFYPATGLITHINHSNSQTRAQDKNHLGSYGSDPDNNNNSNYQFGLFNAPLNLTDNNNQQPATQLTKQGAQVKIPDAYLCSITSEIMLEPVICTLDGITYEKSVIRKWLEKKKESPTRIAMKHDQSINDVLVPNRNLKNAIEDFLIENPQLRNQQYQLSEEEVPTFRP